MSTTYTFPELVELHEHAKDLLAIFREMQPSMSPEKSAEGEAKLTRLFFAIDREVESMREQTEERQ